MKRIFAILVSAVALAAVAASVPTNAKVLGQSVAPAPAMACGPFGCNAWDGSDDSDPLPDDLRDRQPPIGDYDDGQTANGHVACTIGGVRVWVPIGECDTLDYRSLPGWINDYPAYDPNQSSTEPWLPDYDNECAWRADDCPGISGGCSGY